LYKFEAMIMTDAIPSATPNLDSSDRSYPVHVRAVLDSPVSRWLWLVKWLLIVPHVLVLLVLWPAFWLLSIVALVAIVITGRYPRAIFDFNLGVMRWSWRVSYYAYGVLGTDRYPPFSLGKEPDYPATLDVDYPERLSRGLALVKWWLLALPHYLILAILIGGGTWFTWTMDDNAWAWGGSLVGLLVLIAAIILTFTGAYPRPLFDIIVGIHRWALRVAGYAALMTDRYPPFRLDTGGDESTGPATTDAAQAPGSAPAGP
jgi:Domain of unknown function (DUF4389)